MLASSFQRTFALPLFPTASVVGAKTAAKLQLFPLRASVFGTFFQIFFDRFPTR
jgi:hypothetical protein